MTEMLLPIPAIPAGLREAAQRGILIPFIGAGASRIAGCPGWADFADGALECLIAMGILDYSQFAQIKHLNPRVKLSLFRSLAADSGATIDFRSLLHPVEPRDHKKGFRLYSSLFKLGKTFVTTNYDSWLDERIPISPPSLVAVPAPSETSSLERMHVVHRVEEFLPSVLSESNAVIHLHGSLLDPKGMIVTTQDYVRHYANDRLASKAGTQENRVLTFLEYLFENKTVLFIGYGLDELEILEYVILKARRPPGAPDEARHFILQGFYPHEDALFRSLRSYYLKECGIQLIPFLRDHKDWDQMLEVVEEFARLMPATAPLVLQKAQEMEKLLDG